MELINELMIEYLELQKEAKSFEEQMSEKKERIKILMNENNMTFFEDVSGNTIKKISQTRETLNKACVKELLTEEQFKSAIKVTEFESLRIQSAESKAKQMKFLKEKK